MDSLGSLFSHAVGREGCCKQILLARACSVSSTLGLPLLAAHTAQALCSFAGELSEAGPRLHAPPGLSRSGSALRKPSEAQIWLGLRFVPFPGPSSSGSLASAVAVTMAFPCCSVFWVYCWRSFSGG